MLYSFIAICFIFVLGCFHYYVDTRPKNKYFLPKTGTIAIIFLGVIISMPIGILEGFIRFCFYFVRSHTIQFIEGFMSTSKQAIMLPNKYGLYHSPKHLDEVFTKMKKMTIWEMSKYADIHTISLINEGKIDKLIQMLLSRKAEWKQFLSATSIGNVAYIHENLDEKPIFLRTEKDDENLALCRNIIDDFKKMEDSELKAILQNQMTDVIEFPISNYK